MTPSLDTTIIRDSVLDAALGLVSDPIPNIRFNVAKALEVLAVTLSADAEGQELAGRKIVPALEKLCGDSDPDVRCESYLLYFSKTHFTGQKLTTIVCQHRYRLCWSCVGEDDGRRTNVA